MNNSNKTTRELAQIWWGKLPEKDREILLTYHTNLGTLKDINSMTQSVETIYLSEHPEQAVKEESQDNSKERFTSGEWVAMNKTGTGIYKIVSDTLQEICETQMPYGDDLSRPEVFKQGEANARLIAQAPDMYRLLLDARKLLQLTEIIHKSVECGKVAKNITSLLNRIDNK